jgi:hypothetical protein
MPGFQCGFLGHIAAQPFAQFPGVVSVYLRIVAPARNGDIRQPRIDKFIAGLFGVYVYEDAVGGGSLAAVAGEIMFIIGVQVFPKI